MTPIIHVVTSLSPFLTYLLSPRAPPNSDSAPPPTQTKMVAVLKNPDTSSNVVPEDARWRRYCRSLHNCQRYGLRSLVYLWQRVPQNYVGNYLGPCVGITFEALAFQMRSSGHHRLRPAPGIKTLAGPCIYTYLMHTFSIVILSLLLGQSHLATLHFHGVQFAQLPVSFGKTFQVLEGLFTY